MTLGLQLETQGAQTRCRARKQGQGQSSYVPDHQGKLRVPMARANDGEKSTTGLPPRMSGKELQALATTVSG